MSADHHVLRIHDLYCPTCDTVWFDVEHNSLLGEYPSCPTCDGPRKVTFAGMQAPLDGSFTPRTVEDGQVLRSRMDEKVYLADLEHRLGKKFYLETNNPSARKAKNDAKRHRAWQKRMARGITNDMMTDYNAECARKANEVEAAQVARNQDPAPARAEFAKSTPPIAALVSPPTSNAPKMKFGPEWT